MYQNTMRCVAIRLAGTAVLLAGCHLPVPGTARREAYEHHDRPLNARQVAEVQISLARSLEGRGEFDAALNAYRQAGEKDPRLTVAYWRMAVLLDKQGKFTESEPHYRQALKLDASNSDLLCDYGYSLYLQRRWGESEERLRKVIALHPDYARAHNHLGMLLAQLERTDEALVEFRKAGCSTADARSNLAFVMTLNHRWDEARRQYELAIEANPDSSVARTGLDNLATVVASATSGRGSIALVNAELPATNGPPEQPAQQIPLRTLPASEHR